MVKGNAYGHGLREIVGILSDYTDWFAVDDIEELLELRKYSDKPVLVVGYISKEELKEYLSGKHAAKRQQNTSFSIYDTGRAQFLDNLVQKLNSKAKIHIKIDILLGRQGILPTQLTDFIQDLHKLKNLDVEAIYSHFSNLGETPDFSHSYKQLNAFREAVNIFRSSGYPNIKTHISKTGGILMFEKNRKKSDFVRLGIGLYGLWPEKEIERRFKGDKLDLKESLNLKPVLRWITHIAQVKLLPEGFPIGYGLTYITTRPTKIAVIPQGYSDGYDRGLSNSGEVLIQGTRCKVLGRISMNMFTVDVSHLEDVRAEEEVVLLGIQGKEEIPAEEIAERLGTINYEVVARINPLLPRKVVGTI